MKDKTYTSTGINPNKYCTKCGTYLTTIYLIIGEIKICCKCYPKRNK